MAVKPSDFALTPDQLRQRYTNAELEESLRLIRKYGEARYTSDFANIVPKDPGKMDVFSYEYGTTVASNIIPSTINLFTGLADMIFNPIDTAEAIYDAGLEGTANALKEQYGDWESIKRTFAEDPMGQATMVAPGFGLLGRAKTAQRIGQSMAETATRASQKLPASIRPLGGLMADATARVAKPAYNLAVNPVDAIGSVALKGVSSLIKFQGALGRVALEFVTGESVQALEAMQRAGRLTDKQMDIAGLNPLHWAGRIADPEKLEAFGKTDYQQFKQARQLGSKTIGGFKDESAIVGHINKITEDFGGGLLQEMDLLMEDVFRSSKAAADDLEVSNAIPWGVPGQERRFLVQNFNDKIKHLNIQFLYDSDAQRYFYKPAGPGKFLLGAGADKLIPWVTETLNSGLHRTDNIKDAFMGNATKRFAGTMEQPGIVQQLVAQTGKTGNIELVSAFYDSMREYVDAMLPAAHTKALNTLLPESGQLRKLIENPAGDPDNRLANILRHWELKVNLENNYAAMKAGDAPDEVATLNAYINSLQSNPVKKQMIDELEKITGESIHAAIAGLISRKLTPSSLVARGSAVSAAQRVLAGGLASVMYNPQFLAFIPFSSPFIVGKILSTIGLSKRSVDYGKALARAMGQHKIGKYMKQHSDVIWSMGTVLDHIQRYNSMNNPQQEDTP